MRTTWARGHWRQKLRESVGRAPDRSLARKPYRLSRTWRMPPRQACCSPGLHPRARARRAFRAAILDDWLRWVHYRIAAPRGEQAVWPQSPWDRWACPPKAWNCPETQARTKLAWTDWNSV